MPHTLSFNWVDIVFLTLLIRICYVAFKKGFLPEFFRSMGLLSALVVSVSSYALVSEFLSGKTKWAGAKPDVVSFLFIFIVVLFIFKIISILVRVFLGGENISLFSRLAGIALGFGRGLLIISLIYNMLLGSPFKYLSKSAKDRSLSGKYISDIAFLVYRGCVNFCPGEKNKTPLRELFNKN
ncbi:MAG: CvpA family protein [Candidatus Omnitrophica bacterium]|nr:CvpA family protein [Candidatus Omnitrophota bacterium]